MCLVVCKTLLNPICWCWFGFSFFSCWVFLHSFIKPDVFDHNVPFDNTTPIYLPWKLGFGLGLDLNLHYFSIF